MKYIITYNSGKEYIVDDFEDLYEPIENIAGTEEAIEVCSWAEHAYWEDKYEHYRFIITMKED